MARPWRIVEGAVELRVRLTPKSARDAVEGLQQLDEDSWVVAARVRAVPEGGKANAALEKLIARLACTAKRDVSLVSGARGRIKTLRIAGDPGAVIERLESLHRDLDPVQAGEFEREK
jgi:hypothetical protein